MSAAEEDDEEASESDSSWDSPLVSPLSSVDDVFPPRSALDDGARVVVTESGTRTDPVQMVCNGISQSLVHFDKI